MRPGAFCSTSLIPRHVCHVPKSHFLALLLEWAMARFSPACCNALYHQDAGAPILCRPVCSSRRIGICLEDLFRLVHRIAWRTTRSHFAKRQSSFHRLPLIFLCLLHVFMFASHRARVEARNSASRGPFLYIRKTQSMTISNHTVRQTGLVSPDF
jgi:hypothetical protein